MALHSAVVVVVLAALGAAVLCEGQPKCTVGCSAKKLVEVFSWKYIDFAYPDDYSRQEAFVRGTYNPENAAPVGMEIYKDKLFITTPRWKEGVPSTLNYIPLSSSPHEGPKLIPYPSWEFNKEGNCNGITTAYRIKADTCGRLWALDSGTVGIGNTTEQVCPYSLIVFDLQTDRVIRRYRFKDSDTNTNTFIANIAVDVGYHCDDAFAYMSDELGYGLVVYSWELDDSWRIKHGYFHPDPLYGDFNIAGLNFQWEEEGIFGMALSPLGADGYRTLFFHPLASHREFAVSTAVLRNKELADKSYDKFVALPERGPLSHVTASVMSDEGVMFYNLIDRNAVGCWNSRLPYVPGNQGMVDRDNERLIFPSDVKLDVHGNVWVMSDRMPVFLLSKLNYSDINFRIFFTPVAEALRDTVCEPRPPLVLPPANQLSLPPSLASAYQLFLPSSLPSAHQLSFSGLRPLHF